MKRRSHRSAFTLLGSLALVTAAVGFAHLAPGCAPQGVGQRCDTANGNDDCEEDLVCTDSTTLQSNSDICCPGPTSTKEPGLACTPGGLTTGAGSGVTGSTSTATGTTTTGGSTTTTGAGMGGGGMGGMGGAGGMTGATTGGTGGGGMGGAGGGGV